MSETHDCDFAELAAARALHALEPHDDRLLDEHLATCARCRADLTAHEEIAALLGGTVEQHEPPNSLRERVLTTVEGSSHVRATNSVNEDSVKSPGRGTSERGSTVVSLTGRAQRRQRRWARPVFAVAAVVLVVAVVALGLRVQQLGADRQAQADRADRITHTLSNPGAQLVQLRGKQGSNVATLVVAPGSASLLATDIPRTTDRTTLVAWGWTDGKPQALASFDMHDERDVSLNLPANADRLAHFAISLEQGKTAPAAPSNIIGASA